MILVAKRQWQVSLASALACSLLFVAAPHAQAVGISPPIINAPNLLHGSTQDFSVTLLNEGAKDTDSYFSVTPRGTHADFVKGAPDFIIPAGKTSATYHFTIDTTYAPIGNYEVLLTFTQAANPAGLSGQKKNTVNGSVAVLQGATLVMRLTVTGDQVLAYKLIDAHVEDTEMTMPLVFDYTVQNTGNVEWRPDRIVLNTVGTLDPTLHATLNMSGGQILYVKPGVVQNYKIQLDHTMQEGKYSGQAEFYYNGARVGNITTQPFNVFAPGTLAQTGELTALATNKTDYKIGENIKESATFSNTGDVTVEGVLITEIYKGDTLVDMLRTPTLDVDRHAEASFDQVTTLLTAGDYSFHAYVQYGNRKSAVKTVDLTVSGGGNIMQTAMVLITAVFTSVVAFFVNIFHTFLHLFGLK